MARVYLFADEAGNFDFSPSGSRYFLLTTVVMPDCMIGDALSALRRDLAWRGVSVPNGFHATEDRQAVRDEVFAVINDFDFRIDATIIEKAKSREHLRRDDETFYRYAWFFHMKHVAPLIANPDDEMLVIGASLGTKKKQDTMTKAISHVVGQTAKSPYVTVDAWSAASDPCVQVADYCCWAIQRKWEKQDTRSYALIEDKIQSEFDLFRWGAKRYF